MVNDTAGIEKIEQGPLTKRNEEEKCCVRMFVCVRIYIYDSVRASQSTRKHTYIIVDGISLSSASVLCVIKFIFIC